MKLALVALAVAALAIAGLVTLWPTRPVPAPVAEIRVVTGSGPRAGPVALHSEAEETPTLSALPATGQAQHDDPAAPHEAHSPDYAKIGVQPAI